VEQVPEVNDKGKPLNDQQRANYLFNLAVKESQKEKAKTLPEKQAEEAKQKALVADKENQIELEALTENNLMIGRINWEKQYPSWMKRKTRIIRQRNGRCQSRTGSSKQYH
jgi:hypothetical protein